MKQRLFILLAFIAIAVTSFADEVTIDGINYNLNSDTNEATVTYGGDCSGDIVIPEKITYEDVEYVVTGIGENAFTENYALKSVKISKYISEIAFAAFVLCPSLESIVVDQNNATYCSNDNVLFSKDMMEIICYPGGGKKNYTIPDCVTSIAPLAFAACTELTSVNIPNSVKSIGHSAFVLCSSLKSITIPNSVTSIGEEAFAMCESLSSVIIPNYITSIEAGTFAACYGLTSVILPNSVTNIGSAAFLGCSELKSLTIPKNVTNIGESAFEDCEDITLIFEGTEPPITNRLTFPYNGPVYLEVPYEALEDYKSELWWDNNIHIYTLGDANLSSELPDVVDFNSVVNFILGYGYDSDSFVFQCADYNKNGVVNVGDAVAIGRLVVNGTTESRAKRFAPSLAPKSGHAILNASDKTILAGTEFTLPVSIAPDTYSSMQMDVLIPEGFNVIDVVNVAGAEEHSLFYGTPEDGMLRIMLGSLENTKMGDAPIVNIKLSANEDLTDGQYDFAISNILAVMPNLTVHSGKNAQATVSIEGSTAIRNNTMSGMKLSYTDSGICLTSDNIQNVTVRSLDGKIITNESLNAGETKTLSLPAGIYIINNNKVVIK